jgi:hypothetical protein
MRRMKTNTKIKLGAIAAATFVVAGSSVAVAATEPWNPKEEGQAIIDDAAQQLGVQPDELTDALKQALKNRVDDAVAAGRLTEQQAAELKARIDASDVPWPLGITGPKAFGFGVGPDHAGPLGALSTAADYLGLSEAELRSRLSDGKTLAQIAKAENKSVDGLVQALLDDAGEKLDAAVDAGKLTRTEADKIRADWKERITDFVNGETPFGFHLGFDKDGFGFHERFEYRFGGPSVSPWLPRGPSA